MTTTATAERKSGAEERRGGKSDGKSEAAATAVTMRVCV
jgi:hypothetical protein